MRTSGKDAGYASPLPFDVLIDLVQFVNDHIKLLSHTLCLHNSSVQFSFCALEALMERIYRGLSFCDVYLNFLCA